MSGRKSQLISYHAVINGDMSGTVTSPATTITYQDNIAMFLKWTGTPVGTFAFQGSVDNSNWVAIPNEPPVTASGTADTALIDLNQLPFNYVRVVYTAGSSTGTLNAFIDAKQI